MYRLAFNLTRDALPLRPGPYSVCYCEPTPGNDCSRGVEYRQIAASLRLEGVVQKVELSPALPPTLRAVTLQVTVFSPGAYLVCMAGQDLNGRNCTALDTGCLAYSRSPLQSVPGANVVHLPLFQHRLSPSLSSVLVWCYDSSKPRAVMPDLGDDAMVVGLGGDLATSSNGLPLVYYTPVGKSFPLTLQRLAPVTVQGWGAALASIKLVREGDSCGGGVQPSLVEGEGGTGS
jgi:hypothetical protein